MVPEGWSFKTLDNAKIKVIDGDRGKEYPKASDFLETGYCLFLSAKNVTKAGFLFEDLQFINEDKDKKLRKGRVERGNIVLTTRGSVGQFAYYDNSIPYDVIRINSGMVVIDATQSELLPEFFYALCRSFIVAKQIEAASFGSAQPQLTVGIIKGIKLPIPSLPEQKKIAQILSTWD
uniref:restriction endonuclease subunit S n=2 Tax=Pseudomonadota TaxID=1224 RepID=UPI0020961D01